MIWDKANRDLCKDTPWARSDFRGLIRCNRSGIRDRGRIRKICSPLKHSLKRDTAYNEQEKKRPPEAVCQLGHYTVSFDRRDQDNL